MTEYNCRCEDVKKIRHVFLVDGRKSTFDVCEKHAQFLLELTTIQLLEIVKN